MEKIVTLSRVVGITTREFYTRKFGFEVLGDNIKVFYKQGWHYRGYGVLHSPLMGTFNSTKFQTNKFLKYYNYM